VRLWCCLHCRSEGAGLAVVLAAGDSGLLHGVRPVGAGAGACTCGGIGAGATGRTPCSRPLSPRPEQRPDQHLHLRQCRQHHQAHPRQPRPGLTWTPEGHLATLAEAGKTTATPTTPTAIASSPRTPTAPARSPSPTQRTQAGRRQHAPRRHPLLHHNGETIAVRSGAAISYCSPTSRTRPRRRSTPPPSTSPAASNSPSDRTEPPPASSRAPRARRRHHRPDGLTHLGAREYDRPPAASSPWTRSHRPRRPRPDERLLLLPNNPSPVRPGRAPAPRARRRHDHRQQWGQRPG